MKYLTFLKMISQKKHIKFSLADIFFKWCLGVIYSIRMYINRTSKNLLILCYHSIDNSGWRYSTTIEDFEAQLDYLIEHYEIVSLADLLNNKTRGNKVSITFDDGYKDFLTNALPILNKKRVTGTLFVVGNVNNPNRKTLDNDKKLMTLEDIKKVKDAGWEIGFHTDTHADLKLSNEEQLRKEIIDGKVNLEQKLGFKIRYFAYPMGRYNDNVKNIVKKAGFEAAYTTEATIINNHNSDPLLIPRLVIDGMHNVNEFKGLLSPLGLIISKYFMIALKIKEALTVKITTFKVKKIFASI